MQGLIYINIYKDLSFRFDNPIVSGVRKAKRIPYFELDNFSDALVKQYAIKFIEEHISILSVIDIEDSADKFDLLPVFNRLLKNELPLILLRGNHEVIEKLLSRCSNVQVFQEDEEAVKALLSFC